MKRLVFALLILVASLIAACGSEATPPNAAQTVGLETTPEIVAEVTPEIVPPDNPTWVTVHRPDPDFPGWELQHPEGWDIVELDEKNIFLYSAPNIGLTLFTDGLKAGQLVFQISLNITTDASQEVSQHLGVLTGTMRDFVFGETTPYSAAGLDGVQRTGQSERLGLTVLATSRQLRPGQFVDMFVYSRSDELDANMPTISTVIDTVRYAFPTE